MLDGARKAVATCANVKSRLFKKLVKHSIPVPFIVPSKTTDLHEKLGEMSESEAVEEVTKVAYSVDKNLQMRHFFRPL